MTSTESHYIGGHWVAPHSAGRQAIIDPASEAVVGQVALADAQDVSRAVAAARDAFENTKPVDVETRLAWLDQVTQSLQDHSAVMAEAISTEMGAPKRLATRAQVPAGVMQFKTTRDALQQFKFEEAVGSTIVRRAPIGVCALITPWNWPLNQIAAKVAPAIAAGCTIVLKPSELAPLSAAVFAQALDQTELARGFFNMVQGDGAVAGQALCSHEHVDMISFTGSTAAGRAISRNAADRIKRVALELGGKSAGIVLADAELGKVIPKMVRAMMSNSGQSCNAITRVLVPRADLRRAEELAAEAADGLSVGVPSDDPHMGPIANAKQYARVIDLIENAAREGARTVNRSTSELPPTGYFVRPTIFSDVTADMQIAREEVFGPVMCLIPYDSMAEAVALANDSDYGLSGAVWGANNDEVLAVARQLRTGTVHLNGAPMDMQAPFGGFKQSGNGREFGRYGLDEFLEYQSVYGGAT